MTAYRNQAERDEYPPEENEPVKETKKREPLPEWLWPSLAMVASSVAIGSFVEGCTRTGYHGVFGGLIGAASLIGIGALVRMMVRYG